LPKLVRVSLGSAIVLGLLNGKLDASPTTAYLMTYKEGKCSANCQFCPQATKSQSRADLLSRISWPVFSTRRVIDEVQSAVRNRVVNRICIQALNYPEVFLQLRALVKTIRKQMDARISISCQPLTRENVKSMAEAGAERIGIPLDAATEKLFDKIKGLSAGGPYSWRKQFELLNAAVNIFGEGKVSTHLIVGLGETDSEMVDVIQECVKIGVLPALFAFTPVFGTGLEGESQPPIERYRRIQVARSLILHRVTTFKKMRFGEDEQLVDFGVNKQTLDLIVRSGEPFVTSGCPDCNRPYYNEKPSGPIYNFPRQLEEKELYEIRGQLGLNGA
jgi:biotin synthase-related radical SAM superfamily protein